MSIYQIRFLPRIEEIRQVVNYNRIPQLPFYLKLAKYIYEQVASKLMAIRNFEADQKFCMKIDTN